MKFIFQVIFEESIEFLLQKDRAYILRSYV